MIVKCKHCHKKFKAYPYEKGRVKYCSKKCQYSCPQFRKKISKANLGYKHSLKARVKMSITKKRLYKIGQIIVWNKGKDFLQIKGPKHYKWKGNKVGYDALHDWVNRYLGKAVKCEYCGKKGMGRQIHWANKSHKYKRKLADWLSLCAKCHKKYDLDYRKIYA